MLAYVHNEVFSFYFSIQRVGQFYTLLTINFIVLVNETEVRFASFCLSFENFWVLVNVQKGFCFII